MYRGNINCKSEGPQKMREKNVATKGVLQSKRLPVKTRFTYQLNASNCKIPKTGEKKTLTPVADSAMSNAETGSTNLEKGKDDKSIDEVAAEATRPAKAKTDRKQNIKPGNSVPVIIGAATMAKSFSGTHKKIADAKEATRPTALKRVSYESESKNIVLSPKMELKHVESPPKKYSNIPSRIDSGKVAGLQKCSTCPPAVKLKEVEKGATDNANIKRTLPSQSPTNSHGEEVSKLKEKTRSLSPETTARKTADKIPDKKPGERSRSTEVKRMKSEGSSVNFQRLRVSPRSTSLQARQAASEIRDLNVNKKHKNFLYGRAGADETISAENEPPKTSLKSQVVHVHNAEILVTGVEVKDGNEKPDPAMNQTPAQELTDARSDLSSLSSLRPVKFYDTFDSVERKKFISDALDLDKTIWEDLDEKIRETCDKADLEYEIGEDSGDSFSDIISQLYLPQDKDQPKSGKSEESSDTPDEDKKSHPPDLKVEEKFQQKEAAKAKEAFRPKKHVEQSLEKKAEEPVKLKLVLDSKKGKSRVDNGPRKATDQKTKCKQTPQKLEKIMAIDGKSIKLNDTKNQESQPEILTVPSEFFKTHRNVGFIGKVEDEECVSFDPARVTLYQPQESQMLLYDVANCIAAQAYMKMCGINYKLAERRNAEHMSPSGKVPFVSSCLCIIPEFEGIVSFMQYKKYSCIRIEERDKAAFRATTSMIVDTLETAERYICWYDDETMMKYTKPRVGGLFPFPLNHIIYWKKRYEERKRLAEEEVKEKSMDDILREITSCFATLSQILGDNNNFFGNSYTEIDALVYGHIYAVFSTEQEGLFRDLQFIIKQFPSLLIFAINFDKMLLLDKFSCINLPNRGESPVMANV